NAQYFGVSPSGSTSSPGRLAVTFCTTHLRSASPPGNSRPCEYISTLLPRISPTPPHSPSTSPWPAPQSPPETRASHATSPLPQPNPSISGNSHAWSDRESPGRGQPQRGGHEDSFVHA